MNGPPYDVFDPNKYTKAYLEEEDPQTGKKKYERCDLFNKQPLKKTEKEENCGRKVDGMEILRRLSLIVVDGQKTDERKSDERKTGQKADERKTGQKADERKTLEIEPATDQKKPSNGIELKQIEPAIDQKYSS